METDGSDCPEGGNSTDCLLRTLLHLLREQRQDDDAETNWDPITFWLTLVIGVAAMIIAGFAALQAVLAGARGRRKANRRAIGDWSIHTDTHRNWRDMSVLSTTWTPVLRTDTLLTWHPEFEEMSDDTYEDTSDTEDTGSIQVDDPQNTQDSEQLEGENVPEDNYSSGSDGRFGILRTIYSKLTKALETILHHQREKEPTAATWVGFFEELGLTKVNLPEDHKGLRKTVADYLPDDLIAAPAYAQFSVIIAAAAAAGAHFQYVEGEKRYPVILGRNFQFEFRQHPILGTFGAYSRYGAVDSKSGAPGPEELGMAMKHVRGAFEPNSRLIVDDHSGRPPKHKISTSFSFHDDGLRRRINVPANYSPILSLFSFGTPKYIPAIFPTQALKTSLPITALALNGRYWKSLRLETFRSTEISMWPSSVWSSSMLPTPPNWPRWVWYGSYARVIEDDNYIFEGLDQRFDNEVVNSKIANLAKVRSFTAKLSANQNALEQRQARADAAKLAVSEAADVDKKELELQHAKAEIEVNEAQRKLAYVENIIRDLEAESRKLAEGSCGHCVVLHMCIKFLDDPEKFLGWFFDAPSEIQRYLRWITRRQMEEAESWLLLRSETTGTVNLRVDLLRTMTVILLNAEFAEETPFKGQEIVNQERGDEDVPRRQHVARRDQAKTDSPFWRHTTALERLRQLVDDFGFDMSPEAVSRLVSPFGVLHEYELKSIQGKIEKCGDRLRPLLGDTDYWPPPPDTFYRIMEAIQEIVVDHFEGNGPNGGASDATVDQNRPGGSSKEQSSTTIQKTSEDTDGEQVTVEVDDEDFEEEEDTDEDKAATDEVIIYRCLMAALLFRTAPDSTEVLKSGLWDQIIPII